MLSKQIFALAAIFAIIAVASCLGGVKDILGNYYDFTTGQISSSLTGHVYNTVPQPVPVAHYVGGYVASPYVHAGPVVYSSPLLLKK